MQSPKEIQKAFREKDWFDTYHKVPEDIPSWCKCFGLEPDPRVFDYMDLRFYIKERVDWFGEFTYEMILTVTGRNHKIVVHLLEFKDYCSTGKPSIGRNKFIPGHSKKDKDWIYYDLGYDIPLEIVADGYEDQGEYYTKWKWDDNTPTSVYVGRMIGFIKELTPYFKTVYDSYYNGEFDRLWKKYYKRKYVNGDLTNSGFGVGLRGLANIMLFGKRMFDVEIGLEEALSMSSRVYQDGFFSRSDKLKGKDEELISNIMFWNRGGQREDYRSLTKEKFLKLVSGE